MKPVSWKAMIVVLMALLMSISSACADRLGDAYTDTPPAEVLSHLKEKFGAYLLEDYIAIPGTPQGDYGFALLSRKAERVLVGYHRDGQRMAYGLKNAGAVPQGEGYVFFQRHSADDIISFGNSDATYPDALGFDVIRIDPEHEEYWSQSVSYHWEKGGFKLQDYMDRSEGYEAAYVTDDGVRYYDFTYAEPRGYVEGSVQRNLRYVNFSALPKTKAQAKEKLATAPAIPHGELSAESIRFTGGRKYEVYAAPSSASLRGANGKATVSTNDWIQVFGAENGYVAVARATPRQSVEVIPTAEKTLLLSELPDEFASCFQTVDASVRFLFPHVRGSLWNEAWQESDTFLPILMLDDAATLCFLEKDADDIWHARQMKKVFSFTDFSQEGNVKLTAIDTFSYWPETIVPYDGSTLAGTLHYGCMVTAGETEYAISADYEMNEQAASGWIWEALHVLPASKANGLSTSVESDCFPGIRFDAWKVCRVGNNLQYQYNLNDQHHLMFDVETPYVEEDYDLLVIDERVLLGEPRLFFSAEIDTDKHGNGKAVNLRARPEGKIMEKLPNGASVRMGNLSHDWCLVKYGELWGFVDARFVVGTDAYEQKEGGG